MNSFISHEEGINVQFSDEEMIFIIKIGGIAFRFGATCLRRFAPSFAPEKIFLLFCY